MRVNENDIKIGHLLRSYRSVSGVSQQEIAKQLGVTFQQVQKYETGRNRISAPNLFKIARILSIPISNFDPEAPSHIQEQNDPQLYKIAGIFSQIKNPTIQKNLIDLIKAMNNTMGNH